MDYLKKRQRIRNRLYSKTSLIILGILLILIIKPTWNIYKKSKESEANLERAKQELKFLEERENEVVQNLEYLESEHGRDQEIRDKFGVIKEGETMVVLVKDKDTAPTVIEEEKRSWVSRAWSRFKSWF